MLQIARAAAARARHGPAVCVGVRQRVWCSFSAGQVGAHHLQHDLLGELCMRSDKDVITVSSSQWCSECLCNNVGREMNGIRCTSDFD